MRWIQNKAFAYPVLSFEKTGEESDYVGHAFQATLDFKILRDKKFEITAHCITKEKSLLEMISSRKAEYAVEILCQKTFFRHLLTSKEANFGDKVQKGALDGRVELSPYIVCVENMESHTSESFHKEFEGKPSFNHEPGDVLAVGAPVTYFVSPKPNENLRAIFQISTSEGIKDGSFELDWDEQNIVILMTEQDRKLFQPAHDNNQMLFSLLSSIYLLALMETLRFMVSEEGETYRDSRWFNAIIDKMKKQNMGDLREGSDFLSLAQQLLELPVGKMLKQWSE